MARNLHSVGMDVLGSEQTGRGILIRVNNAAQLARSQGALATIAQSLLPATVEAKVYSAMAEKLSSSLKEQGVDADVSIVTNPDSWKSAKASTVTARDVGIGLMALGGIAVAFRFLAGGRRR